MADWSCLRRYVLGVRYSFVPSPLSTNKRQEQTTRLQWRSLISFGGGTAKTDRLRRRRCIQFIRILFREDFNLDAADKHEWMDGAKILYEIEIWQVGVEARE